MFKERDILYLTPEEFKGISSEQLPNIVLKLRISGKTRHIDFGTILYQKHTKVNRKNNAASVVKKTLITELIKPLHEYLIFMTEKYSHASIFHYLKVIRNISKHLYANQLELKISIKSYALEIYKNFTQHLIMLRATKLKDSIADLGKYNRQQNVLAEILSRSLNMNVQEIKNSYIEISSKHKSHNEPMSEDKFQIFFESQIQISSATHL